MHDKHEDVEARRFGTTAAGADTWLSASDGPLPPCAACAAELAAAMARRAREQAAVAEAEAGPAGAAATHPWRVLHAGWARRWQAYVAATDLATPPPGPIDNTPLLLKRPPPPPPGPAAGAAAAAAATLAAWPETAVRPRLRARTDYLAVSAAAWDVLHAAYGGGPALPRAHTDLYRPDDDNE